MIHGNSGDITYRIAGYVRDVLRGCLKQDQAAIVSAKALSKGAVHAPERPSLLVSGAWDLFYRCLDDGGDNSLRDFTLAQSVRAFETPGLVQAMANEFAPPAGSPLASASVLACRHLMASTVAEIDTIRRALPGVQFAEVLGKPYSANRLAILALHERGISVNLESCDIPGLKSQPLGSYGPWHRNVTRSAVDAYVKDATVPKDGPLLVIDDGGTLIDAVGQRVLTGEITQPVVAVEQTTHGLFAVRQFLKEPTAPKNGFAVISVADSQAKLALESRLIARSVVEQMKVWLQYLDRAHVSRIGVIGFGPVGALVAKELSSEFAVTIYDKNRRKLVLAHLVPRLNVAWTLSDLLRGSEVVIAASGGTAIDANTSSEIQDGALLVSASSGDLEFSELRRWPITSRGLLPDGAGSTPFESAHGLLEVDFGAGRTASIVNRGFPVNFDGSPDPIPAQDIQLTRALMVGAVLQAAGGCGGVSLVGKTDLFDLDENVDGFALEAFEKLGTRATSRRQEPAPTRRPPHSGTYGDTRETNLSGLAASRIPT